MATRDPISPELLNTLTHGLGLAASIAVLSVMIVFAALNGSAVHVVGVSIFGAALVLCYLASTLYHAFSAPRVKAVLRVFDHSSIFVLIAGTYTPFCLVSLQGAWGWSIFGCIWGLAVLGIVLKAVFGLRWEVLSLGLYLLMGWLVVVALGPLMRVLPRPGLYWLMGGGLAYTLGTVFYAWERWRYAHAVWHLFVILGSACHVVAVMGYVLPW